MDHRFRLVALFAVALALTLYASTAIAAKPTVSYPTSSKGTVSPMNPIVQNIINAVNAHPQGGAAYVAGVPAQILDKQFNVVAEAKASPSSIARAVAKGAKFLGAAGVLAWAAENIRCRASTSGEWSCDVGQPKVEQTGWCTAGRCYKTAQEGAAIEFAAVKDQLGAPYGLVTSGSMQCTYSAGTNTWGCAQHYYRLNSVGNPQPNQSVWTATFGAQQVLLCPDGSQAFGDQCTTQENQWQPSTTDQVADKLTPKAAEDPVGVSNEVLQGGGSIEPDNEGKPTVSGPPTIQHEPTTKTVTAPNGDPQVTTSTTVTHITYMGDSFTWTNVTTINHPDGTVEVIGEKPKEEDKSLCEKHPEILACAEGDQPPEDPIQTKEIPVTLGVDGGWGGGGQCPPPVQLSAGGVPYTYSYQPLCDFFIGMRPVVLAVAGLVSAVMFIAAVRGSK